MNKKPNALANEASPYLLQHAHNPVDWMPWGDAAFDKAKSEDKPVFLSIGYATCHWCHVMERESFENEKIAEYLNENFVSIKVDREERPDIDAVYMAVTQGLNEGRGGWPMSVWLTPDKQPITAGTYFPPDDRHGRAGFLSVLRRLRDLWHDERDKLVQQAADITDWLRKQGAGDSAGGELTEAVLRQNFEHMKLSFDERYGGFDRAPKFPTPHRIQALLRWHAQTGDADALRMAEVTLDNMARGGIYDQVGGGFHRYSTDREWLTPHFEKMLYDQALMMQACLDLFQITGNEHWGDVVRGTADYVLRDLRDEDGGFHSAEDADSEGEEGKFYVWTMDELRGLLGKDADLAAYVWGCEERGNFFDESTRERTGANILHLPRSLEASAKARDLTPQELRVFVGNWRETLFHVREKRERPLLDDKVVTDWNGLMIGAMARAGAVLNRPDYLQAAREAADFVLTELSREGRLLHRYRKGQAGILGYAEDYAFMAGGLFELYEADFNTRWLREADRLAGEMLRLFQRENGLLFTQGQDEPDRMIAPHTNLFDGAIPSANGAGAYALMRLGRLLQRDEFVNAGNGILEAMSARLADMPTAHAYALLALEWRLLPTREVVIAGDADAAQPFLDELRKRFLPRTAIALNDGCEIGELVPFVKSQTPINGKPAAYVCENYTCQAPATDIESLRKALAG
jgi:uncharacterized protein